MRFGEKLRSCGKRLPTTAAGIMSWMGQVNPDDLPAYTYYKKFEIADMYGGEVSVKP